MYRGRLVALVAALAFSAGCEGNRHENAQRSEAHETEAALRLSPGIQLVPWGERTTSELGGRARTLWVQLLSPPRADVLVTLSSSDTSEGSVAPTSLTFSPLTWWLPRPVRVTGVADIVLDGDAPFDVHAAAASSDPRYAQARATVRYVNRDEAAFHLVSGPAALQVMSSAEAMDSSGEVVVGFFEGRPGRHALRWTPQEALTELSRPLGAAYGVSPDGSFMVGQVLADRGESRNYPEAVLWREGEPGFEFLQPKVEPPTNELYVFLSATHVTNEGAVFGECTQYLGSGAPVGCRPGDPFMEPLAMFSFIHAINDTGSVLVGELRGNPRDPTYYTEQAVASTVGRLPYPADTLCISPSSCRSWAYDTSNDGSVIVGSAWLPAPGEPNAQDNRYTAFVYEAAAMRRLPDLPGGEEASGANAVSADGQVIAGFGTDELGRHAVLWLGEAPRRARDVLAEAGVTVPADLALLEVTALSNDGRTLAGNARNQRGADVAFRAVLPRLR